MITEIGHFALVLALCVALVQAVVPLVGAARGDPAADRLGAAGGAGAVPVRRDRVRRADARLRGLATSRSPTSRPIRNSMKPLLYKISGVWGNHEGSMLLWVFILALFGAAVALFGRNLPPPLRARVLAVQAMIGVGFLLFILFTSNPFLRLLPAPPDGAGLNPILQDPGLAFHPPFLYLGYVGFSIAFCFAVAALIEGRVDAAWARWVRPWTLAAWCALTIGIALGSWWAYYTLGWGGWWFWDPVENASFMPWLVGTALLHSAIVVEKRDALKSWTDPAGDPRLLAVPARHLPGALGRADLGARLRHRPDARRLHPAAAEPLHRRRAAAVRLARAAAAGRRAVRADLARGRAAAQQPAAGDGGGDGVARHALSAVPRRRRAAEGLGRPAVLQRHLRAADGAAAGRDGGRADAAVEARRSLRRRWRG